MPKIAFFRLNAECCFAKRHQTHSYCHLVTVEPRIPSVSTIIDRVTKQNQIWSKRPQNVPTRNQTP